MAALSTAHAEVSADLGALGASTEAAFNDRLATTRQKHEEALHHFMGTTPAHEPVIRITTPQPAMPRAGDGPQLDAAGYANGAAADGAQP